VEVVFTGRGLTGERDEVLRSIAPEAPGVAWAKQIHSARVLDAGEPGLQGEGDALVTSEDDLALCVITADCVPILLAGPGGLAAVHAGWRGIAGEIVAATVAKLTGPLSEWTAWVGPAIGACCYEVGPEVAEQIAAASHPAAVLPGPGGKPHLDLHAAVRRQLAASGIGEVVCVPECTRCEKESLWSYRREGKGAGRNHAFIWRT
jgi:YfiH family protein